MHNKRFLRWVPALLLATNTAFGLNIGLNFGADEVSGTASGTLAPATVAGVVPQANWNNISGAVGTTFPNTIVADLGGIAVGTFVSVTWSSPNTWSSTGRGEENNGFPAGGDRTLMTGHLDTGNTGASGAAVTISGIGSDFAAAGYDVYVYFLGGVAGRGGAYTIGGTTKFGTLPANPSAHSEDAGVDLTDTGTYVRFAGMTLLSFTLVGSADSALDPALVNFRAPISAIQIVASVPVVPGVGVPDSGSNALMLLCGLGLLAGFGRLRKHDEGSPRY